MLKIDRNNQVLNKLEAPSLSQVEITERYDLQAFILNSPQAFFGELNEELFLIGQEIQPSETVQDRIDLLAIDKEGTVVIVELKRGSHKLQMLQAISYAAMISRWEPDEINTFLDEEQQEQLNDFLECDFGDINRQQRIVLIAEAYDFSLLSSAEWLSENYGVNINCCRISLATDNENGAEFLVCSNVYPAPELAAQAISRGRTKPKAESAKWPDWEMAIDNIVNPDIAEFFRTQIDSGRESYLPKRILHYRVEGKRRWFMAARQKHVYVWQTGRFIDDVEYWTNLLSRDAKIKPVKNEKSLRIFMDRGGDIDAFHQAVTSEITRKSWLNRTDEENKLDLS